MMLEIVKSEPNFLIMKFAFKTRARQLKVAIKTLLCSGLNFVFSPINFCRLWFSNGLEKFNFNFNFDSADLSKSAQLLQACS